MKQKVIDHIVSLLYRCDADTLQAIDRVVGNLVEGSQTHGRRKRKDNPND